MMVVYTVLIGNHDVLRPALFPGSAHYICFSDKPVEAEGWEYRHFARQLEDPRRDSRRPKIRPDLFLPGYEVSLYHDANWQLLADPVALCEKQLKETRLAFFRHRDRGCLYDEAVICTGYKLDTAARFAEQTRRYEAQGMPRHWGLFYGGIILRRHRESGVLGFSELWWDEYCRGSCRDQISLPYALWKTGIKYTVIPGDPCRNPHFSGGPHKP
jgi:hypothetical protein